METRVEEKTMDSKFIDIVKEIVAEIGEDDVRNIADYQSLISEYTHTLTMYFNSAQALTICGSSHYKKGEVAKAVADYTKAIDFDAEYAPAYLNRGIVYGIENDTEKAVVDLKHALKLDPGSVDAKVALEAVQRLKIYLGEKGATRVRKRAVGIKTEKSTTRDHTEQVKKNRENEFVILNLTKDKICNIL
jgi:tetratricopeptide (TPR) repeat protein